MDRALVLGGGGITGIAWETGLALGLRRAGVDLTRADLVVGTSAGSVVGTMIASREDLEARVAHEQSRDASDAPAALDMSAVMMAFALLADPQLDPKEARARVGKLALEAPVGDEAPYIDRIGSLVHTATWPDSPRLIITGVDALTGEPVRWDHASHVPLAHAVAASCAVPCIFPPVTLQGRRYVDGGVRSVLNADLAAGARIVVAIAPVAAMLGPSWERERARLGDAKTLLLAPDELALEAIGPNVMDASRQAAALQAGLAQGARVADEVRAVWG